LVKKKSKSRSTNRVVIVIVIAVCIVAVAAVIAAAFAGIEPFSSFKDRLLTGATNSNSTESKPPEPISEPVATIVRLYACESCGRVLMVGLSPTPSTKADVPYKVDMFQKGVLLQTGSITWSQVELDFNRAKVVNFDLTDEEWNAYEGHDVYDIFSVTIHE